MEGFRGLGFALGEKVSASWHDAHPVTGPFLAAGCMLCPRLGELSERCSSLILSTLRPKRFSHGLEAQSGLSF